MIKSSKHTIKFSNKNKINKLNDFLLEYNFIANKLIDYIWSNKIEHKYGTLDIKNKIYNVPKYLDYKELILKSNRNNKKYKCQCGYENDADLNAALNNTLNLCYIDFKSIDSNKGFYWMIEGSLESPLHKN